MRQRQYTPSLKAVLAKTKEKTKRHDTQIERATVVVALSSA